MRFCLFMCLALLSLSLFAAPDLNRQQIEQRIVPVGKVRVQEGEVADGSPEGKPEPVQKGQAIYDKHCVVCHRDGIAGAPKFRIEADWKPRLASKDIDAITASAITGLNAMPAKGTCFDCSEADIKAAIQYMVPQS